MNEMTIYDGLEGDLATSDVLGLHRDLVEIPSLSHEEEEAADFLERYFVLNGLIPVRMGNNVLVTVDGPSDSNADPRTLLLNSHLDVVPPSADHPFPAFEPTLEGGLIYGRGSVDAKGCVASMASAICRLHASGSLAPGTRLMGAFTICEETGGQDNGLEAILPDLPRMDAVLVGEPTHMQPCVAQKGLLILRLDAKGRSAHAARASEGDNAISKMVRDLTRLESWTFDRVHPFLGETTHSVTVIEGGTARNVIPDRCSSWIDIRSTPSYTHDEIAGMLDEHLESDVVIHSGRFVPTETAFDSAIVRACLKGHSGSEAFGSPTMSDWIHVKDLPTVKIGPGDSRLSHTAKEHISARELHDSCALYEAIITAYFQENHV
ncbi:MAG: M20/M25/M40 family metallo-hydrolase [Bacteroidetes bacterium]|nr:M20/M25/M40 family metallo-hydrolase [Bacteroidota bacterium]